MLENATGWISSIWNMGILTVEGRPISIGTLITATIVFVIGLLVSRWASRFFGQLLGRHLRQRDVHLDAAAPLDVRIVPQADPALKSAVGEE